MRNSAIILAILIGLTGTANAAFTVQPNMVVLTDAPTDAKSGQLQADNEAKIWFEGKVTTVAPFTVDHNGSDGHYTSFASLTETTLVPGTYESYMIHFDPITSGGSGVNGSVTFDSNYKIVGVVLRPGASSGTGSTPDRLMVTDAVFNVPGTLYNSGDVWRGLEMGTEPDRDRFTISDNGRTFSFFTTDQLYATTGVDQVRLIVQAVPEFTTVLSWAMLAGIGCVVFRRYKN